MIVTPSPHHVKLPETDSLLLNLDSCDRNRYNRCDHIERVKVMTINEYQQLAMRTLNPELSRKDVLINSVMGLCGESGEAIDIVKKHLHQGHELDREKLIKELGDIAWYLAETAAALDVSLEEVLERNIEKLRSRYPEGFSPDRSVNREA